MFPYVQAVGKLYSARFYWGGGAGELAVCGIGRGCLYKVVFLQYGSLFVHVLLYLDFAVCVIVCILVVGGLGVHYT